MLPKSLTVGAWINLHKALVIPVVLTLMAIYGNWSVEAFVYLSLHGTYSLLWLAKQTLYPDSKFAERSRFGSVSCSCSCRSPATTWRPIS
jgi:hypothetical protein